MITTAIVWLAACGSQNVAPSPAAAGAEEADTISAADMRAHVEVLASDEYNGRETLQDGAHKAATYISDHFAGIGLKPLPGQEAFKVPYTLFQSKIDATFTASSGEYQVGSDFRVFPFSDAGEIDADVVFAGYGVSAPDLDYDDYDGLDVKGKIVLILRHTPGEDVEGGPFTKNDTHSRFLTKASVAAEKGALGMILVTDPNNHEDGEDFRSARLMLEEPDGERAESQGPQFLALHVGRSVAQELVKPLGKTLSELQMALDAGESVNGPIEGATAAISVNRDAKAEPVEAINVIGYLEGRNPDEWVVVGSHYDHLGGFEGSGDTIYNGADDNASGTAGMLELAEAFAAEPQPERSLVFVGFSGEEKGLLGSTKSVDNGTLPADKIAFMLNLDMIGRTDNGEVELVGDGFATEIGPIAEAAATQAALDFSLGGDSYAGNSDHHPFYRADVPFMFFFTGLHDDYHQLSDHADKLAYEQMEKIALAAFALVTPVAAGEVTPKFIHHIGWLGAKIQEGVILSIDEESRGAKAGLKQGDTILDFSGKRFREIDPGTLVKLDVTRGDEAHMFEVERAKTGYLGVFPGPLPEGFAKEHGLGEGEGLVLGNIQEDTPADKAGLLDGDVLIRMSGVPIGLMSLRKTLQRIGAGEEVAIVVIREGERLDKTLILGERPERP